MSDATVRTDEAKALDELTIRLRTLLPEEYQSSYEALEPTPMRSAGLKYAADGAVAWDKIWGSFCDLAMAGGPPHKGALLEPGARHEVESKCSRYDEVVEEICRGIIMASELPAGRSPNPGWVRVSCHGPAMADWLLRAITMENVAVRRDGLSLDLPAAPHFRLEKEIKNVVTVIAKTCHYWMGHMPRTQKEAIAILFASMAAESPLIEPEWPSGEAPPSAHDDLRARIADGIHRATGLAATHHRYAGWIGVTCPSIRAAVWLMRAAVASNVLARREETTLFVPVNSVSDGDGDVVVRAVARVYRLAAVAGVV